MYDVEKSLYNRNNNFSKNNIFDEVELCLSRSCNKTCIACPHANTDYNIVNNTYEQYMDIKIVEKVINQLKDMKFTGLIDLAGFGEPTLNPNFLNIFKLIAASGIRTRLVTNGVLFKNDKFLTSFKNIKTDNMECIISTYTKKDVEAFKKYNVGTIKEIFLEDSLEDNIIKFKLNNRAGNVKYNIGNNGYTTCNFCFFMLFIDTNGDVQYCPQEWTKKLVINNINNISLLEVWHNKTKLRTAMLNNERQSLDVCKNCTAIGTVIGNEKRKFYE